MLKGRVFLRENQYVRDVINTFDIMVDKDNSIKNYI